MTARKSISKKRRFDVFKRDSFTCQYCGSAPPKVILHIDHITPVKDGGTNDIDNLVTSCESCNLGKGAASLSDVPESLQKRAAEIKERESQIAGYNEIMVERMKRLETETWAILSSLHGVERLEKAPSNDFLSVKHFVEKLGFWDVIDAAERSFSKLGNRRAAFKYFCGICWNKIREQADAAC